MAEAAAGRVAFVTGAAAGIGRAAALRLGVDGYAVACLDIDENGAEQVAARLRIETIGLPVGALIDRL